MVGSHPGAAGLPDVVTGTNGTLYADGSCTTPLPSSGEITLSKGSTAVTFGFVPTAAGAFSMTIDDRAGTTGRLRKAL